MAKRLGGWLLVLGLVGLLGAAPAPDVDDFVRRGNAAFGRGEYEKALDLYQRAEEFTTDPGLVAFNEATSLFGQEKYADAEARYWLCLGDAGPRIARLLDQAPDRDLPAALRAAAGPRLARVLYNLGACALKRSEGTDSDLLEQAVAFFDHCLRQQPIGPRLRADARHNLELAKELLRRAPKKKDGKNDRSGSERPDDKFPRDNPGQDPGDPGTEPNPRDGARPTDERPDPGDNPQATEETTPGRGNLATLPDTDQVAPLSPEQAEAFLQQAVRRILGERRQYREQAARGSSRDVLDW